MHSFSRKQQTNSATPHHENIEGLFVMLVDSLRPMFAARKDIGDARLVVIVELFRDGEADLAFDALMENLDDMNYEEVISPLSNDQARQLTVVIHRLSASDTAKRQKYLAIVDRISQI